MLKSRMLLVIFLLVLNCVAFAGLKEFTMHSRANCGNNESISWHAGHSYWLKTVSTHAKLDPSNHYTPTERHKVYSVGSDDTEGEYTWRSAAVHWGEGVQGGWVVYGSHYWFDENKRMILIGETFAVDCSIYDGWWD